MQNSDSNTAANELNRDIPPAFRAIESVEVPIAERTSLDNGVPVYLIDAGTQEVVKVEVVFDAGNWYQNAPMIAAVANALISGGTATMTAEQIQRLLKPVGTGLEAIPSLTVDEAAIKHIRHGRVLPATKGEGLKRILDQNGRLVAILQWRDGRGWQPKKVFIP